MAPYKAALLSIAHPFKSILVRRSKPTKLRPGMAALVHQVESWNQQSILRIQRPWKASSQALELQRSSECMGSLSRSNCWSTVQSADAAWCWSRWWHHLETKMAIKTNMSKNYLYQRQIKIASRSWKPSHQILSPLIGCSVFSMDMDHTENWFPSAQRKCCLRFSTKSWKRITTNSAEILNNCKRNYSNWKHKSWAILILKYTKLNRSWMILQRIGIKSWLK